MGEGGRWLCWVELCVDGTKKKKSMQRKEKKKKCRDEWPKVIHSFTSQSSEHIPKLAILSFAPKKKKC